ncbi:hypothetical protein BJV78DRAFT_1124890, partial [Lactifluus subvellereus]
FSPSSSDVRINVFWFTALVFSLSSARLAILIQQWVRDYMHVFQRYIDPLKSARLRERSPGPWRTLRLSRPLYRPTRSFLGRVGRVVGMRTTTIPDPSHGHDGSTVRN